METNPGPRSPVPEACRILCSNVRGISKILSDVRVALSQYDLLLCSETLVLDRRHMLELLVPGFGHPVLLCRDGVPRNGNGSQVLSYRYYFTSPGTLLPQVRHGGPHHVQQCDIVGHTTYSSVP